MIQVTKRNGTKQNFNRGKIVEALRNAFNECDLAVDDSVLSKIAKDIKIYDNIEVETIQDEVETSLMKAGFYDVAKAYIKYRYNHNILRKSNTTDKTILDLLDGNSEYWNKENANKRSYLSTTQHDYLAGITSKDIVERFILDKKTAAMDKAGIIHIHDKDYRVLPELNCITGDSWITIQSNGVVKKLTIKEFANKLNLNINEISDLSKTDYQILSRDGWAGINAVSCRKTSEDEKLYTLYPKIGLPITVTGKHRLPVITEEGNEEIKYVKDITTSDSLLTYTNDINISDGFLDLAKIDCENLGITNLSSFKEYIKYSYKIKNFNKFIKENGGHLYSNQKCINSKDFLRIFNNYSIPVEILLELRVVTYRSKNSSPRFIPYSNELAKLFAYIYADGGVYINKDLGTYQLTFTNTNINIIKDFQYCWKSVFGNVLNILYPSERSTSPCMRLVCSNRILVSLFKNFAGAKKTSVNDISMPDFVLCGNADIKYSYISAMVDTDGDLSTQIHYTSCSKTYCEQLVLVLQSLGYHPTIRLKDKKGSIYKIFSKVGTRNYDSYVVTLSRADELYDLQNHLSSIKYNEQYCYKGISKYYKNTKINKIVITKNPTLVYDIDTTTRWFIANNFVSHNCCLINLKDMLDNGTVVNGYKINSPHRFLTACTIATQIILGVSSSQYGGCTISTSHLAPYLRKSREYFKKNYPENWEKLYKKELTDGVQTFNYQVNSMSNSNGQSPFLSVALYINEDPEYIIENVEIIEEFLRQRIQGLQNEKGVWVTPAFPKLLYFLDENNTKGGEYYWLTKLAAKCTAKRLVPDYISVKKMKELKDGLVYPCMGCRSFLAPWYDKNGKPQSYGRTNLGVITLNLVDVALSSEGDWDKFWKIFDERMDIIHKTHLKFINILKNKSSDVAPILWQYGALTRMKPGEKIGKVFDGTRTSCSFGYAGLYECVLYMTGQSHSYGIGFEKGIEIMKHFNDLINKYKDEDNIGYSPYGSPIESTTYKFAQCLKDRFGIIKGITDHNYITNSYHINVREHIDPFKKLKVEAEYQKYSLGGCISYIESSDMQKNPEAILEIIDYIYNTIMYAEINSKSDYCCNCGYSGEQKIDKDMNWYCPNCGCKDPKKLYHARRVCGYIGVSDYNKGRTQEIKERFVHLDNHNEV